MADINDWKLDEIGTEDEDDVEWYTDNCPYCDAALLDGDSHNSECPYA